MQKKEHILQIDFDKHFLAWSVPELNNRDCIIDINNLKKPFYIWLPG
jgi:hypothetical protein